MSDLVDDLTDLRHLLTEAGVWVHNDYLHVHEDRLTLATAMRLVMRLKRVAGPAFSRRHGAMYAALRKARNSDLSLMAWATHRLTKQDDVLAVIDKAISASRQADFEESRDAK